MIITLILLVPELQLYKGAVSKRLYEINRQNPNRKLLTDE
jgi:hypothetical protein